MSIENRGVFGANGLRDALLHLEDLHPRLNERRFEAPNLVGDLGTSDAIARHVVKIIANDMHFTVGDSRRNTCCLETNFLSRVISAHLPARVKQMSNARKLGNPVVVARQPYHHSSLKRALINASSSSMASAASGPSHRIRSFDPCPAASIIKPMMLLPLTSSPSFDTQISERKRLAIRTNIAAGRA